MIIFLEELEVGSWNFFLLMGYGVFELLRFFRFFIIDVWELGERDFVIFWCLFCRCCLVVGCRG